MPQPRLRATLALVTVAFALLCAVPYAIGAGRAPGEARFTGLVYNDYDQEYYLAAQRSAAEGLRANRFSSEPDAPGPVAELYPLLGRIGAWTGIGPVTLYHAARVAAVVLLPVLVYVLMGLCFSGNRVRALEATVLALFTTGLGTLAPALFSWRTGGDLVVVEATVLRSATLFPHFAVAYLGITACLIAIVSAVQGARPGRCAAWGAAGGLLLGLSHTFLLLPIGLTVAVPAALVGLRWIRGRAPVGEVAGILAAGVSILIPAIPFVVGLRHEMARFEALQGKPFQETPSDRWFTWLAVYAIVLPFALAGAWLWRKSRNGPGGRDVDHGTGLFVLGAALVVDFVLVFTPFTPFQRRFSEGAIIPLAALAAYGLASKPQARRPLLVTVLVMAALGAGRLGTEARYLPESDWQAFAKIGRGDVVLAGDRLGPAIPAFSSGTVYVARSVETMHYGPKRDLRDAFAADPVSPALADLRTAGVNLIVSDLDDPSFAVPPERFPPTCFQRIGAFGPLMLYRPLGTCPVATTPNR